MEIKYKNKAIDKVCTNADAARKEYGEEMARKIQLRIDQISAISTVEELIRSHLGRCHPLHGDRNGQYAMDLVHPYRLIFVKHGIDIQIAEIQEIVDYH